jgi:Cof subfamily protein (haloacid dehalogenase superfamily)
MYRLLALDLDGTLLRHDQVVDERDLAAIAAVRAAGVVVTIVTGRLHSGALAAARACAIDGAIACMEGSHLVEVGSGETLAHHGMSAATSALLRAAFSEHGLAGFVFHRDAIHHDAAGAPYAQYVATWSPNMRMVAAAPDDLPLAAVAIGEPDAVAAVLARLQASAEELFAVSFAVWACPGKHAVLVRAAGPDKGSALAELCRRVGCTVADAVAVGDWVNDIPMLRVAGRSFAMGSAPDAVRAAATDVLTTPAGAGGGIAEAIERAWGIVAG